MNVTVSLFNYFINFGANRQNLKQPEALKKHKQLTKDENHLKCNLSEGRKKKLPYLGR